MQFEDNGKGLLVPSHKIIAAGKYHCELIRKGVKIDEWDDENLVVNQGLNLLLGVMFNQQSQIANWYLGIFQGNYTPVASDTAATFPASSTECSSYTSPTRPLWQGAAPSGQSVTNSANPAVFTFNASQTIYGAFLVSNSTIGGTAGSLYGAAQFSVPKNVVNLDQLLLTYAFAAASA